jgi:hypothetical protein
LPIVTIDLAAGRHLDRLKTGRKKPKGSHADLLIARIALARWHRSRWGDFNRLALPFMTMTPSSR